MTEAALRGAPVEITDLQVGYGGGSVLHSVSIALAPGEIVALLGANGAGKTTLLAALTGRAHPQAGTIRFDGENLHGLSTEARARRGISLVPDGQSIVGELSVEENLQLGALWRHRGPHRQRAIRSIYGMFEPLERRKHADGHQLSGGERQMLALGRALISEPRLIALDEPSLGLAPLVVAQFMQTLTQAARDRGLTVLLAEQNVTSALSIANRGVVLNLGRVVADADAAALAENSALRHAYLGF